MPVLPYGELFSSEKAYVDDAYGDHHPVFNLNVIANIHITISEADLMYMLAVENTFNASYVNVSFAFDNGEIRQNMEIAEFKLRVFRG